MKDERVALSSLQAELVRRQLPCGGWAALASSAQAALEPSCYAALAIGTPASDARERARDFLLGAQNPNGSWPAFSGDDGEGSWVTALAAIALCDLVSAIPARLRGLDWLLRTAGRESNWFWNWKFRTVDRQVRFDPDKYGWPWLPDTVSWVVPTAFAVLAMRQLPCTCGGFEQAPARINCGLAMLLDRACPGGGWNAGNGVVYASALAPHADDTAVALLALQDRHSDFLVQESIRYLESIAPTLSSPWSLAWAVLALTAHRRPASLLLDLLTRLPDLAASEDSSTLAMVCLALDCQRSLPALGVTL